ncbi:bacterial surface protein 26-residue [Enterococcus haemoperoxidus ATCC BAA-382]|uniref:Bacterial surface protein 26-residue n=1 Tax=Enterococcus haemoperoxidus ATCC BAA-382 TaxID=1158608 RepID=R2QZC4_9ENTE|nr:BspA family leucine-rich repeat surface protein [Enterococcus haemoperoxidus]EOI00751.1 bacterial surface protein 26-residue [Enterococcus haemoperoxidus ATCC BAA-382]EOT61985.1 hypothetical protein I583_00985 [Enterococcus haemoperoxidus ATCC BAA-382]OJG50474.1 surface protein [Enterococcus haemoperoxidus]
MKKISICFLTILLIGYICPIFASAEEMNYHKLDESVEGNILEDKSKSSIVDSVDEEEIMEQNEYITDNSENKLEVPNETKQENYEKSLKSIVASGMFGTSKWQIDNTGALHIASGEFINTKNSSPWLPYKNQIKKIVFDGPVKASSNSSHLFSNLNQVIDIENISQFDTSAVTLMRDMFSNASSLKTLDLSNFDTSQVIDMAFMFSYMSSLVNLDVSSFNTSQVVYMRSMFYDTKNIVNLDVSNFNTGLVEDMSGMFTGSGTKNLDMTHFDTSSATDMSGMFSNLNLDSLDLSNFDTSQVKSMAAMFSWTKINNLDVSNFNTSLVKDMGDMFTGTDISSLDLSNFNTTSITNINNMFSGSKLNSLDISNFDMNQVVYMYDMFARMNELKHINLGENFQFKDGVVLPSPSNSLPYYGKWQRDYEGAVYTSKELAETYDGLTMKGNYYWAEKRPTLEVKDSTIYEGDSWDPQDNFVSAADEEGTILSFDPNMTTDVVDTAIPGIYKVTYTNNTVSKTITVTVKENLEKIDAKDSVVYTNDSWKAEDNFLSATDRDGNSIEFNPSMTVDTVNTEIPGTYLVTYINGASLKKINVTVKESQASIKVHDSSIKVGDPWKAEDNFKNATDKDGAQVNFKELTVIGTVDTSKAGRYEITYAYDKISSTVVVLVEEHSDKNKKEINSGNDNFTDKTDNSKKQQRIPSKNKDQILPKTGEQLQGFLVILGLVTSTLSVILLNLRKRFL